MKGYLANIEKETLDNTDYRRVLYTTKQSQLVLMSLDPGVEIGLETHDHIDQFIRIEQGQAQVSIDGVTHNVADDWAVVIPAGAKHNVVNIGDIPVKLYSIYSPPEHQYDTVHASKADDAEEHFDGQTSE